MILPFLLAMICFRYHLEARSKRIGEQNIPEAKHIYIFENPKNTKNLKKNNNNPEKMGLLFDFFFIVGTWTGGFQDEMIQTYPNYPTDFVTNQQRFAAWIPVIAE